ncbi:MAG: hypothetical protein RLZZ584_4234, partial [Pseudomonadota bacterium]
PNAGWALHAAVGRILAQPGASAARLRRTVSSTVRSLVELVRPAGALEALARLDCFELIVCLTPDELLARAIEAQQPQLRVQAASYAPRVDSSQSVDVAPAAPGLVRIHHPLGRIEAAVDFAIHEEDTLEHLFRFRDEGERRARTLLTELRQKDLLFLGCGMPDWMGRAVLRLFNEQRLAAQDRKMEFFCANERDPALNSFLDRYSANTIVFPWQPQEFVAEIATRVGRQRAGNPGTSRGANDAAGGAGAGAGIATRAGSAHQRAPSAFVSYASQDADAARRIADSLARLGFGDIWLDQKVLTTGDDWSTCIDDAIESCDYFVPLLSRQADARREGVFWEEWRKAVKRSVRINDAFVLPVGIDDQPPGKIHYERIFHGVTKVFSELHLLHAPQGQLGAEASAQLSRRVESFGESR